MARSRRPDTPVVAIVTAVALISGLVTAGLHSATDPLAPRLATPLEVFASAHAGDDPSAHLDPLTDSETVLCPACLQQLERQVDLGTAAFAPAATALRPAPSTIGPGSTADSVLAYSSRGPPGS